MGLKIRLSYTYEAKEEDGIGTSNDAAITAIRNLEKKLSEADSTDDVIGVFDDVYYSY
jgi:hypothetical protein